jgi:hypothetical protein
MAIPVQTPRIPAVLIRRVNRVRNRWNPRGDTVDEMFDDFFVLWRAYEATFPRGAPHGKRAVAATVEAIEHVTFASLPSLREWARAVRYFEDANVTALSEWFSDETLTSTTAAKYRQRIAQVARAAAVPERWSRHDSGRLGHVLYDIRCAVVHSSVETSNALSLKIVRPLREALVELVLARAARMSGADFITTQWVFDRHLQEDYA